MEGWKDGQMHEGQLLDGWTDGKKKNIDKFSEDILQLDAT